MGVWWQRVYTKPDTQPPWSRSYRNSKGASGTQPKRMAKETECVHITPYLTCFE